VQLYDVIDLTQRYAVPPETRVLRLKSAQRCLL